MTLIDVFLFGIAMPLLLFGVFLAATGAWDMWKGDRYAIVGVVSGWVIFAVFSIPFLIRFGLVIPV